LSPTAFWDHVSPWYARIQAGTAGPYNQLVPYLGFNDIRLAENEANSHYNSLQVELHARVAKDLTLQTAYTYAKAIDPTTGGGNSYRSGQPFQSLRGLEVRQWAVDFRPHQCRLRQLRAGLSLPKERTNLSLGLSSGFTPPGCMG
jgi:hypothetical protein